MGALTEGAQFLEQLLGSNQRADKYLKSQPSADESLKEQRRVLEAITSGNPMAAASMAGVLAGQFEKGKQIGLTEDPKKIDEDFKQMFLNKVAGTQTGSSVMANGSPVEPGVPQPTEQTPEAIAPTPVQPATQETNEPKISVGGEEQEVTKEYASKAKEILNRVDQPEKMTPFHWILAGMTLGSSEVLRRSTMGKRQTAAKEAELDLLAKAQKISGEEPLQAGEKQKAELEIKKETAKGSATIEAKKMELREKRKDEFRKSINEPLSSAKDLGLVESALTGIDNVTQLLDIGIDDNGVPTLKNKNLLKNKNFLNKNRQSLVQARDQYIAKSLRLESGAVIGEKELKTFKEQFGMDLGWGSFTKNPELIARIVLEQKDQLLATRGRMSPNERVRGAVQTLRGRGYTEEQIEDALERKGLVQF
jgi:hypothetical protein